MKTLKSTLTALFFVSCLLPLRGVEAKEYPKSYKDADFAFQWEYDLSQKGFVTIRGKSTAFSGAEIDEPVKLLIYGLDAEGNRLQFGSQDLGIMEGDEPMDFEITVPAVGKEKNFLFTYKYDFYVDSAPGPIAMEGWFQDSPDPAFKPKMVTNPPGY